MKPLSFLANILIGFGIFFISLAAIAIPNSDKVLTFKPATPALTVVYEGSEPQSFIIKYAKQGYIVQNTSSFGDHNYGYTLVVMVKY